MKPRSRNLYAGDCTYLFFGDTYKLAPNTPMTPDVFHRHIDLIADSGVDTYLCNPNAQVPWYPSKVMPNVITGYTRGDRHFTRGHYPPTNDTDFRPADLEKRIDNDIPFLNNYLDLVEAGVDWVAEISKACRRRRVTPWLTVRMNDMHGANSWEGSYMNSPMQKNPKTRLAGREINPRDGVNRMLQTHSYEPKAARDYYLAMIRELVNEYDYQGLELDWLRCPFCIDPPATDKHRAMMTEWMKEIRALTNARGKKIGKHYPLGVRIPVRLNLLREVGLDVAEWARNGLIDFVGPSNFWQTSWDVPYDALRRELGDDVAIYGVVEAAPNWLFGEDRSLTPPKRYYRLTPQSAEFLRGNAAGKLAMGCDGIEMFNFFCAEEEHHTLGKSERLIKYEALRDIHKLDALRGVEKQYALSSMHGFYMFPHWEYAEQAPVTLEPEWRRAFRVQMCAEGSREARPEGTGVKSRAKGKKKAMELIVQIVIECADKSVPAPDLGVMFNACWPNFDATRTDELLFKCGPYTHHVPDHVALNYRFDPSRIRDGWNEVVVIHGGHQRATPEERRKHSVTIMSVELAVKKQTRVPANATPAKAGAI